MRHDKGKCTSTAQQTLTNLGYHVQEGLIDGSSIGLPQKRRRYFLVASKKEIPDVFSAVTRHRCEKRSVLWAIQDLERHYDPASIFNSSAKHSETNKQRINYLFKNNLFELPDSQRPDCHRLKPHGYTSVYGRMRPDEPAPTITTGFGSTGQGRFVHPNKQRTLTPHEAARVQSFPDAFVFEFKGRRSIQRMIGNAVPPLMAFPLLFEIMRSVR